MTDLLFFDTNVLVYSLDPEDSAKRKTAADLIDDCLDADCLITSVQSLNECYRALTGRRKIASVTAARAFVESLFGASTAPLTAETIHLAWEIEDETRYAWWDCLLLASALLSGCTHFLTEDLGDGHAIRGMTILDPFKNDVASLLF